MANKINKQKSFTIFVDIKGQYTFEVKAETLEEALNIVNATEARELVLNIKEWNDYAVTVSGIYTNV